MDQMKPFGSETRLKNSDELLSSYRTKFPVSERNILPKEEISSCRMTFPVIWQNFQSQKDFFVTERHFLSQEDIFCHRKKFCLKGQNLREEISYSWKNPFTGINFLSQEEMGLLLKRQTEHKKYYLQLLESKWWKALIRKLILLRARS